MENTIQLKQALISVICSINDRNLILSISDFVKSKLASYGHASRCDDVEVPPEVWAVIKRVKPVDVGDEKKEYKEYLNQ